MIDALRDVEGKSPISYISVTNARVSPIRETVQRATLFSSAVTRVVGHSLSGVIESSALVASFKDVEIEVIYKASNGSEIARQSFVIYKTCHPGESQRFDIELERPDQATDYSYVVLNASERLKSNVVPSTFRPLAGSIMGHIPTFLMPKRMA